MSQADPQAKERIRLPFLDGIRGLSALYVVCFHMLQSCWSAKLPAWTSLFAQGHAAVTVFIVLSGFSLMLPISSTGANSLPSFKDFVIRRSRRILPPYYAALVLSVALTFIFPNVLDGHGDDAAFSNGSLSAAFWPSLITHLFLLHNFSPHWIGQFNGPMWSVATEWDIYFLFPLILLPVRSKAGIWVAILAGFAFGAVSFVPQLSLACFWYLGCFAIGMLTADLAFGPKRVSLQPVPLLIGWVLLWIPVWVLTRHTGGVPIPSSRHDYIVLSKFIVSDIMGAFGTSALILASVALSKQGKSALVSFLSSRPVDQLGIMSYSLYLIHLPFVMLTASVLEVHGISGSHLFYALLASLPVLLLVTYVFHVIFERPFMRFKRVAHTAQIVVEPAKEAAAPSLS